MWSALASSQDFDQTPTWPLCGRISENPPPDWRSTDDCPSERWGNADYTDLPLSSTFGPRQKVSADSRYDYHRGIDIPTPVGTPVFAIADGIVIIAGEHRSYSNPLIQLRHYRPGYPSCKNVGCYYSNYMHLDNWTVSVDQAVSKGELIGYTGEAASDFTHLHFEIRNPPSFDSYSSWQGDAIHPLQVLPYSDSSVPTITFDSVDTSIRKSPVVQVTVTTPRVDVTGIELVIYKKKKKAYKLVKQRGNRADANGYNVNPSWFDMDVWNFQYSHKNNSRFPWESFGAGGDNECPYHDDHGATYNANVHLDVQAPDDSRVGLFNGVRIAPAIYNKNTSDYSLTLTFNELKGPAKCIEAYVFLATSDTASEQWGNCSGLE
jgi:murein DD-endopeptidase MepM/ murein hydrolase activator NlpD